MYMHFTINKVIVEKPRPTQPRPIPPTHNILVWLWTMIKGRIIGLRIIDINTKGINKIVWMLEVTIVPLCRLFEIQFSK